MAVVGKRRRFEHARVGCACGWSRLLPFSRIVHCWPGPTIPVGYRWRHKPGRSSIQSGTGAAAKHACSLVNTPALPRCSRLASPPFGSKHGRQSRADRPPAVFGMPANECFPTSIGDRVSATGMQGGGVRLASARSRFASCYRGLGSGLWGGCRPGRQFPVAGRKDGLRWHAVMPAGQCLVTNLVALPGVAKDAQGREDVSLHVRTRCPQ